MTLFSNQNLEFQNDYHFGETCLLFNFKNKLTQESALPAIDVWRAQMDAKPNKKFILIWDCSIMDGFESDAKKRWFECLKDYRNQIAKVHVISHSFLLKTSIKLNLKRITGIDHEVIRSYQDITPVAMTA